MNEIVLLVTDAPEGGLSARALGEPIFTEAANRVRRRGRACDAVRCHFDDQTRPHIIRLHGVGQEIIGTWAEGRRHG